MASPAERHYGREVIGPVPRLVAGLVLVLAAEVRGEEGKP